jgi:hypothetical protein
VEARDRRRFCRRGPARSPRRFVGAHFDSIATPGRSSRGSSAPTHAPVRTRHPGEAAFAQPAGARRAHRRKIKRADSPPFRAASGSASCTRHAPTEDGGRGGPRRAAWESRREKDQPLAAASSTAHVLQGPRRARRCVGCPGPIHPPEHRFRLADRRSHAWARKRGSGGGLKRDIPRDWGPAGRHLPRKPEGLPMPVQASQPAVAT